MSLRLCGESLHIPFLQLLTTWPLQELCNPSLPSLQESQPEILAPFMRQALFCVVYTCCRQFWDVKCCKPRFLVILQKYFTEVRFIHGVTSLGSHLRAHSLTGSPQTSPRATHGLCFDHAPPAGAHSTHHHPAPTLGATVTLGLVFGGGHPGMALTELWASFTWETLDPSFPAV